MSVYHKMDDDIDFINIIAFVLLVFIIWGILYYLFFYKKENVQNFEIRHKNKVETFKAKVQLLEDKINNLIENEPLGVSNIDKEKELFEMYYKGVPDTYDINGKLIRGVEPDSTKAIYYINIIIKSPYGTENDILSLAKIYHYGMHKFERDLNKAEEIYNNLKFESITNDTREKIKEAIADIKKIKVYSWLNLSLETPTIPKITEIIERPREEIENNLPIPPIPTPIPIPKVDQKGYNDPQNTHNPEVLSTIRNSLNNLMKNTPIIKGQGLTSTEIKSYIYTLPDSDKKEDALISLRAIENNPNKLSSTDMTEMDALTLVWNRINNQKKFNKEISNNLKETLFDELATMQEFGVTICSTGRFTHIIDTLNGVDEEVSIKPTYAINEEMMSKSAKIREDMLNQIPELERRQYEAGTSSKQDEFDASLKNTILTKLKEDYVQTGILSNEKFTSTTNIWINDI
jgi:hypothetical protein